MKNLDSQNLTVVIKVKCGEMVQNQQALRKKRTNNVCGYVRKNGANPCTVLSYVTIGFMKRTREFDPYF